MFKEAKDAILEVAELYKDSSDKLIILQASEVTFCVGAYKDYQFFTGLVILFNSEDEIWEIIEGDKAVHTAQLFLAYTSSLFDLVEEKVENEQFGVDKYFN